ncbi:small heat shock protein [Boletus coccyginus]|nr:small heat shock protein [Boletus coccyginus]
MFPFYDITTEFDRLFEDALATRFYSRACTPSTVARQATSRHQDVYRPRMDLHESKDTNTVTATFELPGLTSDGVAIDVHQNRLTVTGNSAASESEEERNYIVRERRPGKISRTLQLPFGTKPEDVKAKMENGILKITFPKTSPEQQAKAIVIE